MYKIYKTNYMGQEIINIIKSSDDGSYIAMLPDESNTDYQEYLKWLEEGNLPSPADIVEPSPTASVTPLPAETN